MSPRHRLSEIDTENKKAICSVCGPIGICYINKGGGRFQWHCREKIRARNRKWARSEKGKAFNERYQKQWAIANKDKISKFNRRQLLKHHGLTEADFNAMVEERNGRCDICRERFDKLCIDHCHKTLKIRGLLCIHCNLVLGYAKDRPGVLQRAVTYLTQS